MFWLVGIILLLELVSGSQFKKEKDLSGSGKGERKEKRKPRSASEGSDGRDYALRIIRDLHYTEDDVLNGNVEVAPLRSQHSFESLPDCNDNFPSSPGRGLKGTHDDIEGRIGMIMKKKNPRAYIASWDSVKSLSDNDEPHRPFTPTSTYFTPKEHRDRRFSESDGKKSKKSDRKKDKDDS